MAESSKVPTVEAITASFPHSVPRIQGRPSFTTLLALKISLGKNAGTMDSRLGGGQHGHLGLVYSPEEYDRHAPGTPFISPAPPAPLELPSNAERERRHDEAIRNWQYCNNVHKALRNLLTAAIEPNFLSALDNQALGFTQISVERILRYLFATFGKIRPLDLDANEARMKTAWNPSESFVNIITQLEHGRDFAATAGYDITDPVLLRYAHVIVTKTGMYFPTLDLWDARPPELLSTWEEFKQVILNAQDRLNEHTATTQQLGYHTANYATAPHPHLPPGFGYTAPSVPGSYSSYPPSVAPGPYYYPPSVVAPSGRFPPSVVTHSDDSSVLHSALAALEARMVDQEARIIERIDSRSSASNNGGGSSSRQRRGNRGTPARTPNTNYCWTHGFIVGAEHTSASCQHPGEGHISTATRTNTQGGSNKNKDKVNL
jgi:hypothetical protein